MASMPDAGLRALVASGRASACGVGPLLHGSRSRISPAIVAGTAVPPTSGAKSIFLWKMPTEVSHNILL
eukprot:SAG11_NODE_9758_length_882_cov_4.375479_1_plen_68_part_10